MKKYDRKVDTKNVEGRANKNYNTTKGGYRGHKGKGRHGKNRDWTPPGYLNNYEKSVWFLNTFSGRKVKRRENDTNDSLIRRFKKMVESAGILKEVKKREHYLSPSQKKREKKKRALKRLRKRLKIEQALQEKEEKQQEESQIAYNNHNR